MLANRVGTLGLWGAIFSTWIDPAICDLYRSMKEEEKEN